MPRLLCALFTISALCFSFAVHPAGATAAGQTAAKSVHVIVRLAGQPSIGVNNLKTRDRFTRGHFRFDSTLPAAQSYADALSRYQDAEIAYLKSQGIDLQVGYRFRYALNGFAAAIPANQLARLQSLTNVLAVTRSRKMVPLDDHSLPLIHVPEEWSASSGGAAQAGRGTYIADIDTGIDTSNACFSDKNTPPSPFGRRYDNADDAKLTNNKVTVVRAFGSQLGQQYTAQDDQGHGTFTASVEACDYNTPTPLGFSISGVAPAAYLMVYDVFPTGDTGQGLYDPSLEAFDAAAKDGPDVINYSIGLITGPGDQTGCASTNPNCVDPVVAEINNLNSGGIPVVVAAGNAGPTKQTVSSPAIAEGAISAGSTTNDRTMYSSVSVSGSGLPSSLSVIPGKLGTNPFKSATASAQMVYVGLGRKPGDDPDNPNANDLAGKDLEGKIALIDRGVMHVSTKLNNVQAIGAIGAIVLDNVDEVEVPTIDMENAFLPYMMIGRVVGQDLLHWVQAHPDTVASLDPAQHVAPVAANVLSDYSARGYGPNYTIEPNLVAPGQDIYGAAQATTPGGDLYSPDGFAIADGTSFSAPHVTGAAALLLQHHNWTPNQVKAVLMETADDKAVTVPGNPNPSAIEIGSGLINVDAASLATAYAWPASLSSGYVNVGYGAQSQTESLSLNDLGLGAGTWSVSVQPVHDSSGLTVSAPSNVSLKSGTPASFQVKFSESSATPIGDYDGNIVLQKGSQTLHVPYLLHVTSMAVTPNTVLLVDDTTPTFQLPANVKPLERKDVNKWYEDALDAIGQRYTLWDEGKLGSPSTVDMQKASAVIYVTGANLDGYSHQNSNFQAMLGPLTANDLMSMRAYLNGGGKVFISGLAAALSDYVWSLVVAGADPISGGFSEYDNRLNDKAAAGGISPPQPSAMVDTNSKRTTNRWLFGGMKKIDFSTKGDGAGDNLAVENSASNQAFSQKLVGVTAMSPIDGDFGAPYGQVWGQAALMTADPTHGPTAGPDVAIVNSDEPTLKSPSQTYRGRSVLFSFDFAGINDNTGYATRAQVLQRIFDWFNDHPAANVSKKSYSAHAKVQLKAQLSALKGLKAVSYDWQIGSKILKATKKPTTYKFPHAGTYRLRVAITDSRGHTAVSPVTNIKVH